MKFNIALFLSVLALTACSEGQKLMKPNQLIDLNPNYVVVGDDDSRTQVKCVYNQKCGKTNNQARKAGFLRVKFPNQSVPNAPSYGECTATRIFYNYIITSAHCVYDIEEGGHAEEIVFFQGKLNKNEHDESRDFITDIWVMKKYVDINLGKSTEDEMEYDIAILKLSNPGGIEDNEEGKYYRGGFTQAFYFKNKYVWNDYNSIKQKVRMHSYPADKRTEELGSTVWTQNDCYARLKNNRLWIHNCDTSSGSSGAALFMTHPKFTPIFDQRKIDQNRQDSLMPGGEKWIFGIHHGGSSSLQENYATYINESRYRVISDIYQGKDPRDPDMFIHTKLSPITYYGGDVKNRCDKRIQFAIRYQNPKGNWVTRGYHSLPGEKPWLRQPTTHNYVQSLSPNVFIRVIEEETGECLRCGKHVFNNPDHYYKMNLDGSYKLDRNGNKINDPLMLDRFLNDGFVKTSFNLVAEERKHFDINYTVDCD